MVKMRQRHLCVFEFEQGTLEEIVAYIQYNVDFIRDRLVAFHADIAPEIRDLLHEIGAVPIRIENPKILQHSKHKQPLLDMPNIAITSHDEGNSAAQKIKIKLDLSDSERVVMEMVEKSSKAPQECESETPKEDKAQDQMQNDTHCTQSESMDSKPVPMETFSRAIRSGEEIVVGTHATFLKDIHAGASIKSYGNLHIYGKCNGILECFGDYIIVNEFAMGRITLQNRDLEGKMLEAVKKSKNLKMLTIENGALSLHELP